MQFKHPEILYALLLLLIPIIIHLFQLRRFQKVDFTNVAFLKKVTIQTRKSSQLKKWLTLLTRLLALACVVFAFAQPFTASKSALNTEKEQVIYVDNSFSMQLKGSNGPLLDRAKQQLFEVLEGDALLSWFTNSESRKNVSANNFKNEVLSIDYSEEQLSLDAVVLKANELFSKSPSAEKELIIISDLQGSGEMPEFDSGLEVRLVHLQPVNTANTSIDTAYVSSKNGEITRLAVKVSGSGEGVNSIPVSLYDNKQLIAKTAADISERNEVEITFDLENTEGIQGELRITDSQLLYDNSLYFSMNPPNKIKTLVINEGNANYLQRLFEQDAYDFSLQDINNLNYNDVPQQDFIVLNELVSIPASLISVLTSFANNGGGLCIVPSRNSEVNSYNSLLQALGFGSLSGSQPQEKKITQISFDHPLYTDVFEKEVTNFQYPKVNSFFGTTSGASRVLQFEDGKPFVLHKDKSYIFTASLDTENSNFKSSPLVVPTFINMARLSLPLPKLYYEIGEVSSFAVPVKLGPDEILTIKDSVQSFIPLQQTKANSVEINTKDEAPNSGNFSIENNGEWVQNISYNYPRKESDLQYIKPGNPEGVQLSNSVAKMFDEIAQANQINSFWKWFVIFAVIFLLLEMLILKFYK